MWDALDQDTGYATRSSEECYLVDGPEKRVYSEKFPGISFKLHLKLIYDRICRKNKKLRF